MDHSGRLDGRGYAFGVNEEEGGTCDLEVMDYQPVSVDMPIMEPSYRVHPKPASD